MKKASELLRESILQEDAAANRIFSQLVDMLERMSKTTGKTSVLSKRLKEEDPGFLKDLAKANKQIADVLKTIEDLEQEYQMASQPHRVE